MSKSYLYILQNTAKILQLTKNFIWKKSLVCFCFLNTFFLKSPSNPLPQTFPWEVWSLHTCSPCTHLPNHTANPGGSGSCQKTSPVTKDRRRMPAMDSRCALLLCLFLIHYHYPGFLPCQDSSNKSCTRPLSCQKYSSSHFFNTLHSDETTNFIKTGRILSCLI